MPKPVFEIDGKYFDSLDAFYDAISARLTTEWWGRNLDAFNDILRGGFRTPEGGFILADLEAARRGAGETLFDILVEIIRAHGPGGAEEEDGVELQLT